MFTRAITFRRVCTVLPLFLEIKVDLTTPRRHQYLRKSLVRGLDVGRFPQLFHDNMFTGPYCKILRHIQTQTHSSPNVF